MGTIENPSPTICYHYLQRTGPSAITSSPSPPAATLPNDHVADMSVAESVSNILSLIHSPYRIAIARTLRGEAAQGLIDSIDQVSDMYSGGITTPIGACETKHGGLRSSSCQS